MQGGKIGITHTRLCDLDDGVQIIQIPLRHDLWYASARAEDHETLANHVVTRLNDTRIAKSQAPDNRAELQGWVPEGGLRGRGAHGLAWCACSPSAGNGDILISA